MKTQYDSEGGKKASTETWMTTTVVIGSLVLAFLPPSVTMFRTPPPENLVFHWWIRFWVAWNVVAFSLFFLVFMGRKSSLGNRVIHLLACGFAVCVGAMLLQWVFEFPYPFGIQKFIQGWYR